MKFRHTLLAALAIFTLSGCGWHTTLYGQTIGTGFGRTIPTEPAQPVQLRGPDGKTSTGIIQIVGDDKERPRIVARWSGCFETVYVPDPTTGLVRKLQRNEDKDTTKDGRPGTGSYAPWGGSLV